MIPLISKQLRTPQAKAILDDFNAALITLESNIGDIVHGAYTLRTAAWSDTVDSLCISLSKLSRRKKKLRNKHVQKLVGSPTSKHSSIQSNIGALILNMSPLFSVTIGKRNVMAHLDLAKAEAALMFDVPVCDVTKTQRDAAKLELQVLLLGMNSISHGNHEAPQAIMREVMYAPRLVAARQLIYKETSIHGT